MRSKPASLSASRVAAPCNNKASTSFCGDAELFLDRMLEQCHQKPKARHPGFGRELVPYFTGEDSEQHKHFSNTDRSGQAPNKAYCRSPSSGRTRSPRSPLSPRFSNGSSTRERRGGASVHDVCGHERVRRHGCAAGRGHSQQASEGIFGSRRTSNKMATTMLGTKQSTSTARTCRGMHHMVSNTSMHSLFAGPGCFQSPSPESLPMPTAVLLAKAICPFPV